MLSKKKSVIQQLELEIKKDREPDRNHEKGGRSFYFFDFDDNVAFLTTEIYIFHKETRAGIALTTGEFAHFSQQIGSSGIYKDYEMIFDDEVGSFRRFRDHQISALTRLMKNKKQAFIEDLAKALDVPDFEWKGPSWNCFYHAVFNQRPLSVITARGHDPKTIQEGIELFVRNEHLPTSPNYLSIYPVSHPEIRVQLGDQERRWSVATLKKAAIRASVERAFELYGYNPHHRFGMSDDDPKNLELIHEAMTELKRDYKEVSFFVISTHRHKLIKHEVFADHISKDSFIKKQQLELF